MFILGTLWNLYDSYDCLINGNCGWRREIYIEEFNILRLMYFIFNIIFQAMLLTFFIIHIKYDLEENKNIHKKINIRKQKYENKNMKN
ncbi:hypothetical protein D0T92_09170 [Neisseria zalophi]|uniref:Uncharacterized protein n=2 Tax=Neisseria zalophi TaxID=640030 RepID=A0A5J6Q0Z9_9NEIS|nr:hypothetical protein D0T92_09170 [Neisseria zalophi]